jgi:peptide/nickel transport system substrate-binding protein
MRILPKTLLRSGTVTLSAAVLTAWLPAVVMAQEATFVLSAREVGAPSYNPIKGTRLNAANTFIYDRMVIQDADQSFHGQLATSWETAVDGMKWTFKLRPKSSSTMASRSMPKPLSGGCQNSMALKTRL